MAGELIIKNGLQVSGSIIADSVTGSFSGSFVGSVTDAVSASYAATASYVNPLVQDVQITGSLQQSGSKSYFLGNVGIGRTSPTSKLHIFSDTHSDFLDNGILVDVSSSDEGEPAIAFRNQSDMGSNYWIVGVNQGGQNLDFAYGTIFTTATTKIRITPTGGIGIGTNSPSAKLHVKGSGTTSATTALLVENSSASPSLVVRDDSKVGIGTGTPTSAFQVGSGNGTLNWAVSTVGYGTGTPQIYNTQITGESSIGVLTNDGTNNLRAKIFVDNTNLVWGLSSIFSNTARPFVISSGNSEWFRITSTGNIGIGTTTPTTKLDVSGSGRFTNNLTVTGSLIAPSITGSLLGTSSYATQALSASYAPGGATFPYTGSAEISGSLIVTGATIVQDGAIGIVSTGTTSATTAFEVKNATPEDLFIVKDDGELSINTTKYSSNGVLTNSGGTVTEVVGWTGMININTTPPIMIDVQNGIIVNVT